jgi:YD repeat-containing protein
MVQKVSENKTQNYTYDYDNRLIQYRDVTNEVLFEYDGNGNRISKSLNGKKTLYINDVLSPVSQVLLETK